MQSEYEIVSDAFVFVHLLLQAHGHNINHFVNTYLKA